MTTSLADDVLYLLQRSCRRAISTSNINSVLAVLSVAINLVSNKYLEALQQKMREPNLGAKLFLGGTAVSKSGTEITTALNDMDVSVEDVLKLWHEVEEQCAEITPEILKEISESRNRGEKPENNMQMYILTCTFDMLCLLMFFFTLHISGVSYC
ncbi:hypothetical protein Droror1_Dr00006041 [Drosera rotundifolia]